MRGQHESADFVGLFRQVVQRAQALHDRPHVGRVLFVRVFVVRSEKEQALFHRAFVVRPEHEREVAIQRFGIGLVTA